VIPPTLTLHQGGTLQRYVEHPPEIAKRVSVAAAAVETPEWSAA